MFRDRTNLYISYRRTFPHHNFDRRNKRSKQKSKNKKKTRFDLLPEEEQGLIDQRESSEFKDFEISDEEDASANNNEDSDIELSTLPPVFIDIADEIDSILKEIDQKTDTLSRLYKKNLLPGFNDRTLDEEEIEKLNYIITSKFQNCFLLVKKLELIRKKNTIDNTFKTKSDLIMLDNIKKNYALKIQQASSNFRKLQNNYIKFLKEDDFEPISNKTRASADIANDTASYDPVLEELETAEAEEYSRSAIQQTQTRLRQSSQMDSIIRQREVEINKIAKGVLEVSAIFKEMQNMVIEQGTILDRIDYNIENTKVSLQLASKQLTKATNYQKQTNKCKLILLLTLVVFTLLMILIVKPKGGSGGNSSNNNNNSDNANSGSSPNNVQNGNGATGGKADDIVNGNRVDEVPGGISHKLL